MRPVHFALLLLAAPVLPMQAQPAFEVATVRPSEGPIPGIPPMFGKQETTADTLIVRHTPLAEIIRRAYRVTNLELTNIPEWVNEERYDIMGKAAAPATDAQLWDMAPALLEQRFKLKFHREVKQVSGLALVVGKGGLKLAPTEGGSDNFQMGNGVFQGKNVPIGRIAGLLTAVTRQVVVDGTGLKGTYDFSIDLQEYQGVSLPTVIQERMGLTLESRKVELQVIVIDHIERPDEN